MPAAVFIATSLTAPDVAATPVPATAIAEAQLRAVNVQIVADHEFMDSLTAADFLLLENGGECR